MNQKKSLCVLLLLNLICFVSINASSPSTTSPLRPLDTRPIPPTVTHTPPVLHKNNPTNNSTSQMSQLYLHDSPESDYEDEEYETKVNEEKTNHEIKNTALQTYYGQLRSRPIRFIVEDQDYIDTPPECTSPTKRKELTSDCQGQEKKCHSPLQTCAIEALLKRAQYNKLTCAKNTSRPRTSTF